MNYRHAFHAGNFADVMKHALLVRMLAYLQRKDTPLRVIDTHAGIGFYDLAGEEAERTLEWRGGVARLAKPFAPEVPLTATTTTSGSISPAARAGARASEAAVG